MFLAFAAVICLANLSFEESIKSGLYGTTQIMRARAAQLVLGSIKRAMHTRGGPGPHRRMLWRRETSVGAQMSSSNRKFSQQRSPGSNGSSSLDCPEGAAVLKKITREQRLAMPGFELKIPVVIVSNEEEERAAERSGALAELRGSKYLGMDTESAQYRTAESCRPSIVQLASYNVVVLYNLRKFGRIPESLQQILNGDAVKICHDESGDTAPLWMNWGVDSMNVLDTLELARAIGSENLSLCDLCAAFTGRSLSKKLQTSNWNRHELSTSQITYAAKDALATLKVYEAMQNFAQTHGVDVPPVSVQPTSRRMELVSQRRRIPFYLQKLNEAVETLIDCKGMHPAQATIDKWRLILRVLEGDLPWPEDAPRVDDPDIVDEAIAIVKGRISIQCTPENMQAIREHNARNEAKEKLKMLCGQMRRKLSFPKGFPTSGRAIQEYEAAREWMAAHAEEDGWDPLVIQEVGRLIAVRIKKLAARAEVEMAEYRRRNMTSVARGMLRQAKERFEKSSSGQRKQVSEEAFKRVSREKVREWVLDQMQISEEPYWHDPEFCEVVLELSSTVPNNDAVADAQRKCRSQQLRQQQQQQQQQQRQQPKPQQQQASPQQQGKEDDDDDSSGNATSAPRS